MGFEKIVAPSIKDLFISQVEEMIFSGELSTGDRLPSERELADTLGISKTIVHEGLRELVRMGLLRVETRKGVYVADYMNTGNLETLFAILKYRGVMPEKRLLRNLLDIRGCLEIPALEEAARHNTPENIQVLVEIQNVMKQMLEQGTEEEFARQLFLYRRSIMHMSGNFIYVMIMNAFFEASVGAWEDYCRFRGREQVLRDLEATTGFLEEGNTTGAIELILADLTLYRDRLM